jgi:ABC-type multidrug transport system fused ATPase/permease subunit
VDCEEPHLDFPLVKMQPRGINSLKRAFRVLTPTDQRKILLVTIFQIMLGALDLFGVLAIGLLGSLSVYGLQARPPSEQIVTILKVLQIEGEAFETQVIVLGAASVIFLVGRTVLSIFFTRKTLFFLSRRGARISSELVSKLLAKSILVVHSRTTQESVYALTSGVERIVLQVLASAVVWVADFTLLLVMAAGLFFVNPVTATITFLVFSAVTLFLYRFMHVRAEELGVQNSKLNIRSNEKTVEVLESYRESVVRHRRHYYSSEIGRLRYELAGTSAEIGFLPYVSKYVIESAVVVGAVVLGGLQFYLYEAVEAATTLVVFLAAGSRIAPAFLRLQQGAINIKSGLGLSEPTLELIQELGSSAVIENDKVDFSVSHEGFRPEVLLRDITFSYPSNDGSAISNFSLKIPIGSSIALVGPSGAGKTTLIDILLGVLPPNSGSILISNHSPLAAIAKWPGAIAYVPQDATVISGTIRENITLGYPRDQISEELITEAIGFAQLTDFVSQLPNGLDTKVGERGSMISGGERQRIGIARAMLTRPKLLVLDEATSSLDGATEAGLTDSIQTLRGSTTVVIIAHRLSTIRNVDQVVYLKKGRVVAAGTFQEVRKAVPEFRDQTSPIR